VNDSVIADHKIPNASAAARLRCEHGGNPIPVSCFFVFKPVETSQPRILLRLNIAKDGIHASTAIVLNDGPNPHERKDCAGFGCRDGHWIEFGHQRNERGSNKKRGDDETFPPSKTDRQENNDPRERKDDERLKGLERDPKLKAGSQEQEPQSESEGRNSGS